MFVSEVMSKKPKTIEPEASLGKALKKMKRNCIGSLVVLKKGRVTGIITLFDIMAGQRNLERIDKLKVHSLMVKRVVTITPTESVIRAMNLMKKNKVRRLPVVEGGKLRGMITTADLFDFEQSVFLKAENLISVRNALRSKIAF